MKMRRSSDRWQQRRWPRFTHALSPSLALPLSLCPSSLLLVTLACCFLTYRYVRLLSVFFYYYYFLPPGLNMCWILPEDERVA